MRGSENIQQRCGGAVAHGNAREIGHQKRNAARRFVLRAGGSQRDSLARKIERDDIVEQRSKRACIESLAAARVHKQRAVRRMRLAQPRKRLHHGRIRAAFQHAAAAFKQRAAVDRVLPAVRREVYKALARDVVAMSAFTDKAAVPPGEGPAACGAAQLRQRGKPGGHSCVPANAASSAPRA